MATFTHEVSPYRRKDGTYLIKIRINHNRKTLRKPTGIYATADQLTRDRNRIRDAALIDAVDKAVERVRMAGVPGLTTYHARHTWATLARNECGIPRDVVDEALNHVQRGGRVTDIYIRRDFTRVWDANRKVLDLVFGK